jgi:HK97 family phage prohead protease
MKQFAHSIFTVKEIDDEKRTIEGIATTPTPDRMGDIVEPEGAEFTLPLPLLWQHNSREPVGHVTAAKVSKTGISITAKMVQVLEAGKLRDRLDEAWQSLKYGLVRGLSIGFTPLESAQIKDTWSYRYLKWDWLELSCVTIAANSDASILSIKSADQLMRAEAMKRRGVVYLDHVITKQVEPAPKRPGVVYLT